jgi:hypothetical protein
MIIKATIDEVIEMAKLAILASNPRGLGYSHYDSSLKKQDIKVVDHFGRVEVDYYQGRKVKFYAARKNEGNWQFPDVISIDNQSWKHKYNSYEKLLEATRNQ